MKAFREIIAGGIKGEMPSFAKKLGERKSAN